MNPTREAVASDITFDAENHQYFYGLERIPSVSEILRPLTETYLANIPEAILTWKRELGIAVHKACELYDLGTLDEDGLDERIVPYLEGYKKFTVDYEPQWHAIEQIVFEPTMRYAGTLDRAGAFRETDAAVIDIKTSVSIQPTAALQLWAYACANDAYACPDLAVLQLLPSGNYNLSWFEDYDLYAATWEALLTLRRWKEKYP